MENVISEKKIFSYLLLCLASFFWSANTIFAKKLGSLIGPCSLAFWRWYVSAILLIPFSWLYIKKDLMIIKKFWKFFFLLSILSITGFNTLIYTALHTTSAINAALISCIMPIVIVVISSIVNDEKIFFHHILGVILCFSGASLVIFQGTFSNMMQIKFVRGDVYLIIATIMYGTYSAMIIKVPTIHPLSFLSTISILGSLALFPLYIMEFFILGPFKFIPEITYSILYVALLPSIFAYICWNKAVKKLGPNIAGTFINLIPIFTSIMAFFFLNESLELYHIKSIFIVILGIIISNTY